MLFIVGIILTIYSIIAINVELLDMFEWIDYASDEALFITVLGILVGVWGLIVGISAMTPKSSDPQKGYFFVAGGIVIMAVRVLAFLVALILMEDFEVVRWFSVSGYLTYAPTFSLIEFFAYFTLPICCIVGGVSLSKSGKATL